MNLPSPNPSPLGLKRRLWAQACAVWMCTGASSGSAQSAGAGPAQMVWPLQLPLLDSPPLSAESLSSMTTVLVFFSIDCPYCRRQNQRLSVLALQAPKLRVLGAALDSDLDALRQYRDIQGLQFAITPDSQALRERVTRRRVIPFTAVVGPNGAFFERIPGEMSDSDILGLARWAAKGA